MAIERLSPERLIALYSHRPSYIVDGVICKPKPAQISSHWRRGSSLGVLGKLPLELLHVIAHDLDLQSLSRQVSLRGREVVASLPVFRDVMDHVPSALAVFGQTRLAGVHTAVAVYEALRTEQCISCRQYGPFLFLPTCERCCHDCLRRNRSLWVTPKSLTNKAFNLTPAKSKDLPALLSIPGTYFVGNRISRRRRLYLLSVKMAKQRALSVHGSLEAIVKSLPEKYSACASESAIKHWWMLKRLQEAPLESLDRNPSLIPSQGNGVNDDYCGMACITFPTLSANNTLEDGHWCLGCERIFHTYNWGQPNSHLASMPPPNGVDPWAVLRGRRNRARNTPEFLQHLKTCTGVQELIRYEV